MSGEEGIRIDMTGKCYGIFRADVGAQFTVNAIIKPESNYLPALLVEAFQCLRRAESNAYAAAITVSIYF